MPGGAAEEMEHFHVPQTVGLIQKKFRFLLSKLRFNLVHLLLHQVSLYRELAAGKI